MNFEDEDYVRLYTRDTPTWHALGWEGQALLALMMRKVGRRNGTLECDGFEPVEALTSVTGLPVKVVRVGFERMLARGVASVENGKIVLPKFLRAQWARTSDAERKRRSRAIQAEREPSTPENLPRKSQPVTQVTDGHTESQPVTNGHSPIPSQLTKEDPPVVPRSAVDEVFEVWKGAHKHPTSKLDRKRRKRIEARIREGFTVEQLSKAIRNARNDPFLMGENEHGRVYDGVETLLRDAAQVERLLALRPANGPRTQTPAHQPFKDPEPSGPTASPQEALAAIAAATAGIGRRIAQ